MVNKIALTLLVAEFFFLAGGALLLVISLMTRSIFHSTPNIQNVAQNLLLMSCPTKAALVNAILVFITFIIVLPAFALPTNRIWLRVHGIFITISASFTLVLGLAIWVSTLQTRSNLSVVWGRQTPQVQSLLQERFNCCGYINSTTPPFQQDSVCGTALIAAQKGGCASPFYTFANSFLDIIFTASFGIVAIDVMVLLCVVMLSKDRGEQTRYKHIDEKNGLGRL